MNTPYRRRTGDRVSYSRAQTARYRSDYLRWLRSASLSPLSVYRAGGLTYFEFARPRGRHIVTYDPSLDTRGQQTGGGNYLDCVPAVDRCVEVRAVNTYRRVRKELCKVDGVVQYDLELPPLVEVNPSPWRVICPGEHIHYGSTVAPPALPQTAPISLLTLPISITTSYSYTYSVRRSGPWSSLSLWGGFRFDSGGDGPDVWRGENFSYLDSVEFQFRDPVTLEPLPAYCPPMPVGGGGGGETEDGYSCTCPDYAKLEHPDPRSPYPSRLRLRDWRASRAGVPDPPRRCKHIYAAMRARGENPRPYNPMRVVLGWPDLPTTPPDADPVELLRGLRGRRQQEWAARLQRREEVAAFVRAFGLFREYSFGFFQPHLNAPEAIRRLRLAYLYGWFDRIGSAELDPNRRRYPYSRPITGDEVFQYMYQSLSAARRRGEAAARRAIQANLEGDEDE